MNDHGLPPMTAPARGRDATGETPRPPHDQASRIIFDAIVIPPLPIEQMVAGRARPNLPLDVILAPFPGVEHRDATYTSFDGAELPLAVFRRTGDAERGPLFVFLHGGGMVTGTRFNGLAPGLDHITRHGGTLVSVEYRRAPEHPAPTPVEDCYAALEWTVAHADELGADPTRVLLGGSSAGGGLAAGVMLLARDRQGPTLIGVLLECPMLDDRNDTTSIRQFFGGGGGFWSGASNEIGWTALLGDARGTDAVSPYDAPARAPWLGGLPPVHIGVGSTDAFRDEDVAFASAIWRDGGDCELYVVPGGPHGFDAAVPTAAVARTLAASRAAWVDRLLHPDDPADAEAARDQLLASFADLMDPGGPDA